MKENPTLKINNCPERQKNNDKYRFSGIFWAHTEIHSFGGITTIFPVQGLFGMKSAFTRLHRYFVDIYALCATYARFDYV